LMIVHQHQQMKNDNDVHQLLVLVVNMFIHLFLLHQQHLQMIFYLVHNHFQQDNVLDIQQHHQQQDHFILNIFYQIKLNMKKMIMMIMYLLIKNHLLIHGQ
jgi:hypothetical protein